MLYLVLGKLQLIHWMFLLHFQLGVRFRVDLSWSFSAFPLIVSASSDSNKAEPRNSFLAGTQASSGWCVVPVHWRTGCVWLPRPVPTPAQFCSDLCTAHTSSIPPRKHSHPLLAGRKVSQGVLFHWLLTLLFAPTVKGHQQSKSDSFVSSVSALAPQNQLDREVNFHKVIYEWL